MRRAPLRSTYGDSASSACRAPGGVGIPASIPSASPPTTLSMVSPSRTPVPAQSQCHDELTRSGVGDATMPLYWMPRNSCSGRRMRRHMSVGADSSDAPGSRSSRQQCMTRLATPRSFLSNRTCQYMLFAVSHAWLTPSRCASSTTSRIGVDQYSSCPGKTSARYHVGSMRRVSMSTVEAYVTSKPERSIHAIALWSRSKRVGGMPSPMNGRSNETARARAG